jgi:selenocysteine lyase/cysteine desulfurase
MNDYDVRWSEFRSQMPVSRRWAYLDHAAVAPLPTSTVAAIQRWLAEASEEGDTVWPRWKQRLTETRHQLAELLNANAAEIALVPNTTAGLALVADGYPWSPGDNVVTLENEFPSNLYPWLNLQSRGVDVRRVEAPRGRVDLDRLVAACDARTRIVTASWVGFASGWRIDVGPLARAVHDRGALLCLDAIQGLGVFPLDVRATDVDFLAADGHKWMLGPEGAGVFYLKLEHLDLLRPLGVGWHSVPHSHDFQHVELKLRAEAARYEGGSHNMVGFLGLGTSLELLARLGLGSARSAIADRVLELGNLAEARLRDHGAELLFERDPQHSTGILTFDLPGHDLQQVRARCLEQGVALSCRGGGLRISLHAYNDVSDLDRLIAALPHRAVAPTRAHR